MRPPVTLDLNGCARCHGEGHKAITFEPLVYPVELGGEESFTHWALCPVNGEPILLRYVDVPEPR